MCSFPRRLPSEAFCRAGAADSAGGARAGVRARGLRGRLTTARAGPTSGGLWPAGRREPRRAWDRSRQRRRLSFRWSPLKMRS
ncbi:unnamed protein product, partial [Prorocentrum cordatum]